MADENYLNVLVLLSPADDIQELLFDKEDVDICYVYNKHRNFISHCFARFKMLLPFDSITYSSDFLHRNLLRYDVIILDETFYPGRIVEYIRKHNPKCKIIYLMWNTVEYSGGSRLYNKWENWNKLLKMRNSYNFEISSFDEGDCRKYDLVYNNQIAPYLREFTTAPKVENKIFFFGRDKGRLSYIDKFYEIFTRMGYICDFNVVPDPRQKYNNIAFRRVKREVIRPYKDIIKREMSAKALLEILQDGQHGLTWRALEALFYGKKLITNFKEIKQYDFYRKQNIFILGIDELNTLKKFMDSPFEAVPDQCIIRYTFKGWFSKMIQK
jgi:ribosomal protein S8